MSEYGLSRAQLEALVTKQADRLAAYENLRAAAKGYLRGTAGDKTRAVLQGTLAALDRLDQEKP